MNRRQTLLSAAALMAGGTVAPMQTSAQTSAPAQSFSANDLARRTIERRAVEAVIWGMPLVNTDAMRQAYFRDAGAKYNDICYFSKPADWRFQVTTPNASTNYVYFNFNLKDGPVVVEIPAAIGAGLLGSMVNAWDEPMNDIGPAGGPHGAARSTSGRRHPQVLKRLRSSPVPAASSGERRRLLLVLSTGPIWASAYLRYPIAHKWPSTFICRPILSTCRRNEQERAKGDYSEQSRHVVLLCLLRVRTASALC
jgi:hypothetical protein